MNYIVVIILFISYIFPECDGFNWYHNINRDDCNENDIHILQEFINNSQTSINLEMDVNLNNIVEPLELGWQLWEEGRLIHWICNDVPSPFYLYNYNCGLSGKLPDKINKLDSIVKLHLQKNNLEGVIPDSICSLDILQSSDYWFKINLNNFCPPYPDCIQPSNTDQNKQKCD